MTPRRTSIGRRLVDTGLGALAARAPWLSDQAYRAASTPLQLLDPMRAAALAHARLDSVRARIERCAATGRVPRSETERIRRDLARTAGDLERLGPRLPPVTARALAVRLEGYLAVLQLPGAGSPARPPARARRLPGRLRRRGTEAAVTAGTAGVTWVGLMLPLTGELAVGGGLVAGTATAAGVLAVRGRRERRARMAELATELSALDAGLQLGHPAATGPGAADLDQARRELVRRVRASRRLDPSGLATLGQIDAALDDLLVRRLDEDLDTDVAYLVEATVTRYLPDTLEPFLALPDPASEVNGRPAVVEVADQLARIERALTQARERPGRRRPETMLHVQGEFLRDKFGSSG